MSKTVAVFGATGQQGGPVAQALLREPSKWKVVVLTRDAKSDKAEKLRALGAEVRACDLTKPEDVEAGLKGAYGVFGVTDFWASRSSEAEIQQGKNIIDAAKKVGVEHLVLSTLEDTVKISEGKRNVEHFVSKAHLEEYLVKSGVPYTTVQPASYYENFKLTVKPNKDGVLEFTLPVAGDYKYANYSVADTGVIVAAVLADKAKYLGKKIAMTGDVISPNEIAAILSKQFGKPVKYNSVPEKVFASFPFPGAAELANMFGWFNEYGYYGETKTGRDILLEGKQVAHLQSFAEWAQNWKL